MVIELEQNEQIEPVADNEEAVVDLAALTAEGGCRRDAQQCRGG